MDLGVRIRDLSEDERETLTIMFFSLLYLVFTKSAERELLLQTTHVHTSTLARAYSNTIYNFK